MLMSGCCSVGTVGSSTSFLFSIRCTNSCISTIELWPIVSYNRLGYSEPAHNVLPYKLNDLFIFDECEGLSFYPFFEVVWGNL